jgi:hypothetical protein
MALAEEGLEWQGAQNQPWALFLHSCGEPFH